MYRLTHSMQHLCVHGGAMVKVTGKRSWFIVLFQANPAHTALHALSPLTGDITPLHWLKKHDANFVHMSGSHFSLGLIGGPLLPMPKTGLELVTLTLPIWCSTNWAIKAPQWQWQWQWQWQSISFNPYNTFYI